MLQRRKEIDGLKKDRGTIENVGQEQTRGVEQKQGLASETGSGGFHPLVCSSRHSSISRMKRVSDVWSLAGDELLQIRSIR